MCISVCWCCLLGCLFLCCRLPIWKRRHVPSNVPTYFEESSSVGDYERWVYKKHYWAVNFIQLTHDLCHILSHLPVIVTLSSFVVECAFPSSLSVPSSSLHTHTHCCHFTTCSFWICSTLELPSQSPVVRCAAVPWWSADKETRWGSWFVQLGSKHGVLSRATHCTVGLRDIQWLVDQNI